MQVNGEIITVQKNQEFKKQAGGTYRGTLLVYRDLEKDRIQEDKIHENTFKYKKPIQTALDNAKAGDSIRITKDKNEQGYWNIVSLEIGKPVSIFKEGESMEVKKEPYVRKDYMADSDRQMLIVKQSSLKAAIDYLGSKASVSKVLETAQEFTKWVFSKEEVDMSKAVEVVSEQDEAEVV